MQRMQQDCVLAIAYWHGPEIQIHGINRSSQLFAGDSIIMKTEGSLNHLIQVCLTAHRLPKPTPYPPSPISPEHNNFWLTERSSEKASHSI